MHVRNCKYNLRDFHMAILYVGQAMYVFVEQQRWINDMNRNQPNKYIAVLCLVCMCSTYTNNKKKKTNKHIPNSRRNSILPQKKTTI